MNPQSIIICEKYQEVFNVKSQNFRIQKQKPAMILAKKQANFLLKTPKNFNIGGRKNFYFSHMLNCMYDCKYCFLQGMYNSANYVVFVNLRNFLEQIKLISLKYPNEKIFFFSGYDCDSLAFEKITGFAKQAILFFKNIRNSVLEIRTKSNYIAPFLNLKPEKNIIFAWSLSPRRTVNNFEFKTPSLEQRLKSISVLQKKEWNIGLRFDPLFYFINYQKIYADFFKEVFSIINQNKIHSITIGTFRLPQNHFKKIKKLGHVNKLLGDLYYYSGNYGYHDDEKNSLILFCQNELKKYVESEKIFLN